jgi:hypothetical protein
MEEVRMITMSKTLLDARTGAETASGIAADADLQLRFTAQISAAEAAAWAKKRPEQGRLTALLDLPDAARLDVKGWLKALQPDVVELRVPAWSADGMAAIGWPAGQDALLRTLAALAAADVEIRLALHVSALTVADLTVGHLAALSGAAGTTELALSLRPVLGEHAPALDQVARALARLARSGAKFTASKLLPACALPAGVDGESTFASERLAAKQAYTPECSGCPARDAGRCDGMAADLLTASLKSGTVWQGWTTWTEARTSDLEIPERIEALEAIELRLGLRRVWQASLSPENVDEFTAAAQANWHVLLGEEMPAEPASPFDIEAEKGSQRVVYVAADAAEAKAAADAQIASRDEDEELAADAHRRLGAALGYPACCVESYIAALPARVADEYQGVSPMAFAALQAARDSAGFDNRLDFASPLRDACLLSHRPCKYDCEASLARVAAIEAELAQSAPGRLASLQKARAQGALLFADGTQIPLDGKARADGGLEQVSTHGLDDASDGPRSRAARAAWAAIAPAVQAGVALIADAPWDGAGGVSIVAADGAQTPLVIPDAGEHVEFPRLIVFSA